MPSTSASLPDRTCRRPSGSRSVFAQAEPASGHPSTAAIRTDRERNHAQAPLLRVVLAVVEAGLDRGRSIKRDRVQRQILFEVADVGTSAPHHVRPPCEVQARFAGKARDRNRALHRSWLTGRQTMDVRANGRNREQVRHAERDELPQRHRLPARRERLRASPCRFSLLDLGVGTMRTMAGKRTLKSNARLREPSLDTETRKMALASPAGHLFQGPQRLRIRAEGVLEQ